MAMGTAMGTAMKMRVPSAAAASKPPAPSQPARARPELMRSCPAHRGVWAAAAPTEGAAQAARLQEPPSPQAVPRPQAQHGRRAALGALAAAAAALTWRPEPAAADSAAIPLLPKAIIRKDIEPDPMKYDPADPRLREAANMIQSALNAEDVREEEAIWTKVIQTYANDDAPWVADVVGRSYGNRGNARSRQGRLAEAIEDYNTSISMCPWSGDPVLNRGVALEALGRFDDAIVDYEAVLLAQPEDPAGFNNLGNAYAGKGQWSDAARYYEIAARLAPAFSFAQANLALANYQIGKKNESIKDVTIATTTNTLPLQLMRSLLRRYPEFPDMRAALAAALWADGLEAEAENAWLRVADPRYRDRKWLRGERRWPPALADALDALLAVRSVVPA